MTELTLPNLSEVSVLWGTILLNNPTKNKTIEYRKLNTILFCHANYETHKDDPTLNQQHYAVVKNTRIHT